MAFRADEKWLQDFIAKGGKVHQNGGPNAGPPSSPALPGSEEPKRAKYGNQKTESGGKRFDSKHEAKVYEELRLRCLAGEFVGLGCQVAFYLPGGIKYIADFVAVLPDQTLVVIDAKSEATKKDKVYRLKKKLMKECLRIEIQEA